MRGLRRRWLIASQLALLGSCVEQGTQALVTVELDPALLGLVERVQVAVVDEAGNPVHGVDSIMLTGADAVTVPFSFGAVPVGSTELDLQVRAFDASRNVLVAQHLKATLALHTKVPLKLSLSTACVDLTCEPRTECSLATGPQWTPSCNPAIADGGGAPTCASHDGACGRGCAWPEDRECPAPNGESCSSAIHCKSEHCVDGFCCDGPCAGDCESCAQPGRPGICTTVVPAVDAQHCGGCNQSCSTNNISMPHCTVATCDGTCAENRDDCNGDKRSDGCETDLLTDEHNCKRCGNVCDFKSCVGGECQAIPVGYVTGEKEVRREANRMYGQIVFNSKAATLAGLGIRLNGDSGYRQAEVKVAVYASTMTQITGKLIRATTEMSTDPATWERSGVVPAHGGLAQRVSPYQLEKETFYWLFFLAAQPVYLTSEETEGTWRESELLPYASVESMPETTGPLTITGPSPIGDLYMITTPARP